MNINLLSTLFLYAVLLHTAQKWGHFILSPAKNVGSCPAVLRELYPCRAHVFHNYNLAFNLFFAVIEL